MTTSKYLQSLKSAQLKHAARCLGLLEAGTKVDLQTSIYQRVDQHFPGNGKGRIVSIDMGIRNLGICVLDAPHLARTAPKLLTNQTLTIEIIAWTKIDVLGLLRAGNPHIAPEDEMSSEGAENNSRSQGKSSKISETRAKRKKKAALESALFTPSKLSKAAYSVVSDILLNYAPDHILIERQRFRSMGGSSIQEWTVRVNMFESMLWACLATLRGEMNANANSCLSQAAHNVQSMDEVNPKKVANFWSSENILDPQEALGNEVVEPKEAAESKGLKKRGGKDEKIAVVQAWLKETREPRHEAKDAHDCPLVFSEGAQETADLFHAALAGRKWRQENGVELPEGMQKLDDLADCLLQGVAWVRWEENRRKLREIIEKEDIGRVSSRPGTVDPPAVAADVYT